MLSGQQNAATSSKKSLDHPAIAVRDTIAAKDTIQEKDLSDVITSIFKKNPYKKKGRDTVTSKPVFSVVAAVGYTLQTRLAAVISGNVAFRSKEAKLSAIQGNVTYTQNKQFYVPVQSNIWTRHNKFNLVGDFRFYKYPQSTFGLGSRSNIANEDPMDYTYFRFYEYVLTKVKGNFFAGLGYILDYRWNISHEGNRNGMPDDYLKYGPQNHSISSGITLNALYATRDNPINASKGIYTNLQVRNNFTALGSNSNWQSLILDVRKYFRFPQRSQNVWAFWSYNWLITKGRPPYLDLPSNGWDSYSCTGRGYIQGRFRGSQMVYLETEYRFKISANGLLGGVVFANGESFSREQGSRLETIQPGYGLGVRIKLKKESKTNLSIDYGFGTQGSKGLFINIGEYF
jgi:outer membrane protein assembly factor BamA